MATDAHYLRYVNRRTAFLVVGALALALGVVLLIGRKADYHTMLRALRSANHLWFPLCLAGEVAAYLGFLFAFRDTVRVERGPRLGFGLAARVVMASFGAFVVATVGGLAVVELALERAGSSRREAIARVLALNTLIYAFLGLIGFAAALATLVGLGADAPLGMTLPWLVVIPIFFALAVWVSAPERHDRLMTAPAARGLLGLPRKGFAAAVHGVVLVRRLLGRPRTCTAGVVGAPLYWVGDAFCLWAALHAFGIHLPLAGLALAYATGYVAAILPLPAGGAGGIDAAMTFALAAVGVALAPALLAVFTYRFFKFWLPMLPALAVLPGLKQVQRQLEEAGAAWHASQPAPAG